jgi:hypothetical protein
VRGWERGNELSYSHIIDGAVSWLVKSLIVTASFYWGRHLSSSYRRKWLICLSLLFFCGLFSLFLQSSLGTHIEDADPIYGGGERIVDFEPTEKQRTEYGLTAFLVLSVSSFYGVFKKKPSKKDQVDFGD